MCSAVSLHELARDGTAEPEVWVDYVPSPDTMFTLLPPDVEFSLDRINETPD